MSVRVSDSLSGAPAAKVIVVVFTDSCVTSSLSLEQEMAKTAVTISIAEIKLVVKAAEDVKNATELLILYYNSSNWKARPTYNPEKKMLENIITGFAFTDQQLTANAFDHYDDILLSKIYKKDEVDFNNQVNIKLKRITTCIRFKVSDESGKPNNFNGRPIKLIELSTGHDGGFSAKFNYYVETGKIETTEPHTASQSFGQGKEPIIGSEDYCYSCLLPRTIKPSEGEITNHVTLTIKTDGGAEYGGDIKIEKTLKLDKDIVLTAGKIKTIKIKLTGDKDTENIKY